MSKMPAFQFYPGDWRKDPGVQALDFFDRGVWLEILCLMHESDERGVLLLNGKPMPEEALARTLGLLKQNLTSCLTRIVEYGVASYRESDGALVCRRMVRDEELRATRSKAGKKGGNPNLLKQNPTTSPSKSEPKTKTSSKQNPTPSSSSSTSTSTSVSCSAAQNKSPASQAAYTSEFESWWKSYPVRNAGSPRGNKRAAFTEWQRLGEREHPRVIDATSRLVAAGQAPKDAERFLRAPRGGGDPVYESWLIDSDGTPYAESERFSRNRDSAAQRKDADCFAYDPGDVSLLTGEAS